MHSARAALLAAVVAVVLGLPALGGGFVHDDKPQIAFNPLVTGLSSLPALWRTGVWVGAGSGSSFYRPLMMTSFALDASVFGRTPLPMHGTQLLLFAVLVFVAVRLLSTFERDVPVALAAGLLLAAHPVNVEPVAWLSARCELLGALFALLCLAARLQRVSPAGLLARTGLAGVAEGGAFFLALVSKESTVAVLPALVAVDRVCGASCRPGALLRRWTGILIALLAYAALRTRALGGLSGGILGATDPLVAVGALGQGALRLLLPIGLTIAPPGPTPAETVLGAVLVVGGAAALFRLWLHRAPALLPLALGLAFLGVAAAGAARIGELADRYLLIPSLACGWLGARAIRSAEPRLGRTGWVAGLLLVAILGLLSFRHAPVYASDEVLWSHAFSRNPASGRAALNVATALLERGDLAEAQVWLARAATLDPQDRLVRLNRAVVAAELGDAPTARRILLGLVAENVSDWPAQLRLGHLALEAGDLEDAAARYEAVLRIHGLSAEAWAALGVVRSRQGRAGDARKAAARALALDPGVPNADALRAILRAKGGGPAR